MENKIQIMVQWLIRLNLLFHLQGLSKCRETKPRSPEWTEASWEASVDLNVTHYPLAHDFKVSFPVSSSIWGRCRTCERWDPPGRNKFLDMELWRWYLSWLSSCLGRWEQPLLYVCYARHEDATLCFPHWSHLKLWDKIHYFLPLGVPARSTGHSGIEVANKYCWEVFQGLSVMGPIDGPY